MRLDTLERRVFFALVLATSAVFLWMVRPLLMPVFWAAVFAVLFQPLYLRVLPAFGGRRAPAAVAVLLVVVLAVLIPFALLASALTQQALRLYQRIITGELVPQAAIDWFERTLPRAMGLLDEYGVETIRLREALQGAAVSLTQYVGGQALVIGQNALLVTALFFLMLYFLFFFLRDGEAIVAAIVRCLPMGDSRERRLLSKFAEVSRATVQGTLVVAAVQGTLGGLMFAFVGVEAPVFWGFVMGVLSLLPAVGPALVWGPAAIIFLVTGGVWEGIFLIVVGSLVVGLVDNLLRPVLIGRQTQMPDYLVLLATLGGIGMFGLAGFVAGPVIAALFLVMWGMFAEEQERSGSGVDPMTGGSSGSAGPLPQEETSSGSLPTREPPLEPPPGMEGSGGSPP